MFEDYLIDFQVDYMTDYQCEVCLDYLDGGGVCNGCGATYTMEKTTIYQRKGVTN